MKLYSQIIILFLSAFLQSAFGKAKLPKGPDRIEDPYISSLKQECKSTLMGPCKDSATNQDKNYLTLLVCLENNIDKLDEQCQKEFFTYKFRLYTNPAFISTLESTCGDEMSNLCGDREGPKQIECLFKAGSSFVKGACSSYLNQIKQVMLSDYSVLSHIAEACSEEMDSQGCTVGIGKLGLFGSPVIKIVQCLMSDVKILSAKCAKRFSPEGSKNKLEVEMHEECKIDFSQLCDASESQSQDDNFQCLMSHLSEISSPSCFETLLERELYYFRTLDIGTDFYQFCSADVKKEQCLSSKVMKSSSEGEFTKLTELLSCLGRESSLLSEECEQEVELLRERFIGEEMLSVEFARACETAREKFCSSNYVSLTDCLTDSLEENRDPKYKECRDQLKLLTSPQDPVQLPPQKQGPLPNRQEGVKQSEHPKIDLQLFCSEELDSLCSTSRNYEYKQTLFCLSQHLSDHKMSQDCGDHIGRVSYFSDRKLVPNSKLAEGCMLALQDICNTDASGRIACLVSHLSTSETGVELLSAECAYEVEAFLKESAASNEMQKDLFSDCLPSLGQFCPPEGSHHTELECLREHQELIGHTSSCFDQLEEFNAVEEKMPSVNQNVQERCHGDILTFCSHVSSHEVVDCLQGSINKPGFHSECKNALIHAMEMSDPEWKFESQLNKNCKKDLSLHCPHVTHVKEAINCLSPIYRSGILTKTCRAYIEPLVDQNALRGDKMQTDVDSPIKGNKPISPLESNCRKELQLLCVTSQPDKYLECLIDFKLDARVSASCQKTIVSEEIEFVVGKHMDEQIMADCRDEIHNLCMFDSSYEVLVCLQSMAKVGAISSTCKKMLDKVSGPLSKLQLDKNLAIECHSVAYQKCKQKLGNSKKLVNCLSRHMRELEAGGENKNCISEVVVLIGQAQLDIDKDPDLEEQCRAELSKYCTNVPMGHGEKIRCLFRIKEDGVKSMGISCSKALMDREELWSILSKKYPNIQRGLDAILDDFENLKKRVYPTIVGILKAVFLLSLGIGAVIICCVCRATRRVRRKIL